MPSKYAFSLDFSLYGRLALALVVCCGGCGGPASTSATDGSVADGSATDGSPSDGSVTDGAAFDASVADGLVIDDASGPLVTVTGVVTQGLGNHAPVPLAGALITLRNSKLTTTTQSDGSFSIQVPAGPAILLGTADTFFPAQVGAIAPATDVGIELIPRQDAIDVLKQLPEALDLNKGIVLVNSDDKSGGFAIAISASHAAQFSLGDGPTATFASALPMGNDTMVFANTAIGSTSVTFTPPANKTCMPRMPINDWPVDPGVMTSLNYHCE